MKTAPDTSQLDIFIRNTLKSSDENFTPFDWSEVEVLLKHEQRSIPIEVNKKTIFTAAVVAGGLLVILGIFKIVQYYSSLPPEPRTLIDTQSTFDAVDTSATAPSVLNAAVPKIDSASFFIAAKKRADSLATLGVVDTASKIKAEVLPVVKTKDKNKKADTTIADTATIRATPIPIIPEDTASNPFKETTIETPAIPDTAAKKTALQNSPSKKKKSKKAASAAPPETKPDSLKQQ
jgi:hypothetical protein